eukprot:546803_1
MMHYFVTLLLTLQTLCDTQQPPYDGIIRETPGEPDRLYAILKPAYQMNHCAFLHYLNSSNELLLAWFSGCAEGGNDTSDVLARININDIKINGIWSDPTVIIQTANYSDQNPVLFTDPITNYLHLIHPRQPASPNNTKANQTLAQIWHSVSKDKRGLNWTLNDNPLFSWNSAFVRQRIVTKLDGSLMLPMYNGPTPSTPTTCSSNFGYIMQSKDTSNVFYPNINTNGTWKQISFGNTSCLVQPNIMRLKNDKPELITFFRDRRLEWIYSSYSNDDGDTWTQPQPTILPNNNAGIGGFVLNNGHIVLAFNPNNIAEPRDPLAIAISEDNGNTWPYGRYLEYHLNDTNDIPPIPNCTNSKGTDRYAYPQIIQTKDNYIHVAYTWQRRAIKYNRITEQWIKNGNLSWT